MYLLAFLPVNYFLVDWQALCVLLGELYQNGELSSQHLKVIFILAEFLKLIIILLFLFYKKAFYYLNSVPFFCLPLGFTRALNFVMKPCYCINNSSMLLLVAYCRICVSTSRGETLYYFKLFVHQRLLVHQNSFKQTLNSICQECFVICRSYWLCKKE